MECLVLIAFMATINKRTNPRFCVTLKRCSARFLRLLCCAGMLIFVAGRSVAGSDTTGTEKNPSDSGQDRPVGILAPSATASKPSSTDSKRGTRDAQNLAGRSTDEVEAALGKPSGKLQTAQGALWLYAEWRGPFDPHSPVLKGEKDQTLRPVQLGPKFFAKGEREGGVE